MANVGAHSTESAWARLRAAQPPEQPPRLSPWEGVANLRLLTTLAARLLWQARGLAGAVALGMLLTVATLCAAPALTATSAILTVQAQLAEAAPLDRNIETYVSSVAPSPTAHARITAQVTDAANSRLGGLSDPQPTAYAVTAPLLLSQPGQPSQTSQAASAAQVGAQLEGWDFSTVAAQMRFLAGAPPVAAPPGQPLQVIITQQMASDLHLRVGSALMVAQFGRFSAPGAGLALVVSGIWAPRQANAPFWNGVSFLGVPAGSLAMVYPVLTAAPDFYRAMAQFPGLSVTQYWVYYTHFSGLTPQTLAAAPGVISRLRSDLETATLRLPSVTDVGVITQLDHLAAMLQAQLQQMSEPVKGLLALMATLACVFVAITSQALSDATARALVNLRSHGASGAQLLGMVGLQATLLAALALLLGPPLALLCVWGLIAARVAGAASGMSLGDIAQDVTPAVLALWAGVGALVGVGATLVGARSSVGETSASFARRQGRAESASRRHAPRDVAVLMIILLLALAGALDLAQFTPAAADQATGASSSLLVMATPALILLSGALLAARLAPIVASWTLAIGLRRRGITLALAMAPLVRGTARFAQMALLTTLALGLACFELVFRAGLLTTQASAATYAVGSDARITQRAAETQGFGSRLLATYARLPGVQAVAPVYRTQEATPAAEGGLSVETLAIDPARFAAVAAGVSWRADFAAQSLPALMSLLARPAPVVAGAPAPWAIISASYAARFDIHVGDHPTLMLSEASSAPMTFSVAAIVQAFPTLVAQDAGGSAGFVVVALASFGAALAAQGTPPIGPNEFWARMTAPGAADVALQRLFATTPQLDIDHLMLLSSARAATELSPVGAGMRALLLLSALAALALAALGALIQTLAAARRERVRFAILRTLGLSQRTLTLLPLQEVLLTQALGLLIGSAVGAALVVAVAPLLRVIEDASAPLAGEGLPIQTIIPWHDFAALAGALLLLTLIVVGVSVWRLTRLSLNRELRISED